MKRKKLRDKKQKVIFDKPISIYWGASFAIILLSITSIFSVRTNHLIKYEISFSKFYPFFYGFIIVWGLWALGGKNGNFQRAIFPIVLAILPYTINNGVILHMSERNTNIVEYKAKLINKERKSARRGVSSYYIVINSKEYGIEKLKLNKNYRLYRYSDIGNEFLIYRNIFDFGYVIDETKIKKINK